MAPDPSPRHRLAPAPVKLNPFRTLPGRLFLLSAVSLALLLVVQLFTVLPGPVEAFRKVVSLGTIVSVLWLLTLYIVAYRHEFLWRVRRKLILSYVFLGFVPVVLVALFVMAGGFILHGNIDPYVPPADVAPLRALGVRDVFTPSDFQIGAIMVRLIATLPS